MPDPIVAGPSNCITVVLGKKGSGKTDLTRQLMLTKPRVLVIDTIGDYEGCQISTPEALAEYLNARGEGPFRVSYRDKGLDGRDWSVKFEMIQQLRRCWVVFEEAGKWVGPTTADPAVKWFVNYGRHNELSTVYIARRPSELHRDITSNADVIVSFQQKEPRDLDYFSQLASEEMADRVGALGQHEWEIVVGDHAETVHALEALSGEVSMAGPVPEGPGEVQDEPEPSPSPVPVIPTPDPVPDPQEPAKRPRGRPRKLPAKSA